MKDVIQRYQWATITLALILSLCFFEHTEAQVMAAVILLYILFTIR